MSIAKFATIEYEYRNTDHQLNSTDPIQQPDTDHEWELVVFSPYQYQHKAVQSRPAYTTHHAAVVWRRVAGARVQTQ